MDKSTSRGSALESVRAPGIVALALGGLLVGLATAECMLAFGLRHSELLGGIALGAVKQVHLAAEWSLVQLDPTCARWDAELTYTLRPPGCTVSHREFTVRYSVNSLGLRDDAESLNAPAVIVLGDSYAMGWGVGDADSFPERLERHFGVRVLNAGISSYGTARELGLLSRLDRSALRALILQFCWNDTDENRNWTSNGGALPTMSEPEYERVVAEQAQALRYWPGKYVLTLGRVVTTRMGRRIGVADARADQSEEVALAVGDVLTIINAHRDLIGARPVVIVPTCAQESAVASALRGRAAAARGEDVATQISVVDPAPWIEARHLYPLDGHFTAAGHRLVARLVGTELVRLGVVGRRSD